MSKPVKSQTNLVKRGAVYWFRARYPQDLIAHYGKAEICFSLRTKDHQEAKEKARIERVRLDQDFVHVRATLNAEPVHTVSETEIERLSAMWHSHLLEEDEESRMEGLSDREFDKKAETLEFVEAVTADQLARGRIDEWLTFEMDDYLESHGIKVDPNSDTYRKLAFAFLKAHRKALDSKKARHRGEVVDTPKVERFTPKAKEDDTLAALLKYWKTQGEKRPRTIMEAETAVRRFTEQTPNVPASRIAKAHLVAFKDKLLEDGKAPATVEKQLNLLRAIFQTAADNEKLPGNPADGVKVQKAKVAQKSRIPFTVDELRQFFSSPVFAQGERPSGGAGEAAFWIPLIALWTGARLEEIGQLAVDDIRTEGGIRYFYLTNSDEQRLKTASSRRKVPIHPELVSCGFDAYLEQMRREKQTRLFPLVRSAGDRQQTASWSQWFGRYLRQTVKITDSRKVFHSFRHGFKDACRESDISKELHDRLTGHGSGGDVGDRYGGEHFPLKPLNEAVQSLRYEGLDLSHLHKK